MVSIYNPASSTPLPGFEPGSQAPEARVLSKLYYGGNRYILNLQFITLSYTKAFFIAVASHATQLYDYVHPLSIICEY